MLRIIQKREAERLAMMMKSEDRELHKLAASILSKSKIRFCLTSIILFHVIAYIASMTFAAYIIDNYIRGAYWLPIVLWMLLQTVCQLGYIIFIVNFRQKYNEEIELFTED